MPNGRYMTRDPQLIGLLPGCGPTAGRTLT